MADVYVPEKVNNDEPIEFTVKDADGAVDLSGATALQWRLWNTRNGSLVVDPEGNGANSNGPGLVAEDLPNGVVKFDPDGAHTDGGHAFQSEDDLKGVLRVVQSDGDDVYWPREGYLRFVLEGSEP